MTFDTTSSRGVPWQRAIIVLALMSAGAYGAYRHQQRFIVAESTDADAASSNMYDCVEKDPLPPTELVSFVDQTDAIKLGFTHCVGPLGTYYMPESVGSGGAICDFDNDGLQDLFLVNSGRSPEGVGDLPEGVREQSCLYQMTSDRTYKDVTQGSGLEQLGYGMGCAVGDVDNDGDIDIYVTNVGQDRLMLNLGGMRFADATAAAGFNEDEWGTGASFLDYDRDGLLDLVVVNYAKDDVYNFSVACGVPGLRVSYCGPQKFSETIDRLYHNEGVEEVDGKLVPRFVDVTESSGLSSATTYGFAAVCADFTGDDWIDIYIASDARPNRLWVNQRDGRFVDEAFSRGVAVNMLGSAEGSMGIAVGDVDGNQSPDIVVTHLSGESTTLYLNDGSGHFVDSTKEAEIDGVTRKRTGWGAALIDLDHDGDLDLPLVHGLVIPCDSGFPPHGEDKFQVRRERIEDSREYWRGYYDRNQLLLNEPAPFRDGTITLGGDFTRALGSGRSLIYGDPDDDGDVDLIVTNSGSRARYYRNDFKKSGHWIRFRVVDPQLKRDALGARVQIDAGGRSWTSTVMPASSYLASNDMRVHFGIGLATSIDRVVVHWPDGPIETCIEDFSGFKIDSDAVIERGSGRIVKAAE